MLFAGLNQILHLVAYCSQLQILRRDITPETQHNPYSSGRFSVQWVITGYQRLYVSRFGQIFWNYPIRQ